MMLTIFKVKVKVKNICFEKIFFSSTGSDYTKKYVSLNVVKTQPSRGVLIQRCSKNLQQIYRRTPMPKCDFNKVALQRY